MGRRFRCAVNRPNVCTGQRRRFSGMDALESRTLFAGYSFQTVATFNPTPLGSTPETSVVVDAIGNRYGTTSAGGAFGKGTIFEVPAGTSTVQTLLSFNGTNGSLPSGTLAVDRNGNIFGNASGGANGTGAIFEISPATSAAPAAAAVVASFPATIRSGIGLVADASGSLYGVSSSGIYTFVPATTSFRLLSSFANQTIYVESLTLDSAGDVFIDSQTNGYSTYSNVYELPAGSSTLQTVYTVNSFTGSAGRLVTDAAGDVFGLLNGSGGTTIFELAAGSFGYQPLTTLNASTVGSDATSLTIDAAGDLFGSALIYGTTTGGTIFELPSGGSSVVVLAPLSADTGSDVAETLTLDTAGNLYGATTAGTADAHGAVIELPAGASAVATVATFNSTNAGTPAGYRTAGFVEDAAGNLFGLTTGGGAYGYGTVYELPRGSSVPVTLASLQNVPGEATADELGLDPFGNLFGFTEGGQSEPDGTFDYGGIFELPAGGSAVHVVTLFNGDNGYDERGQPVFDAAGDMFFTTANAYGGGGDGYGNIAELPHASTSVVDLANFHFSDGEEPSGGLVLDAAGNLFGTCGGGSPGAYDGDIWELTPGAAAVKVLHSFVLGDTVNGDEPYSGLVADANGMLYGTTDNGGSQNAGTIYKFNPKRRR